MAPTSRLGCPVEFIPIKLSVVTCEVHPEIMESVTARPLCLQRSLKGWNEVLQLLHSPTDNRQERGRAGLRPVHAAPASAGYS